MHMVPALQLCKTLTVLRVEYLKAVDELSRLQSLNLQALLVSEVFQVERMLRAARVRRKRASDALLVHSMSHHCENLA
jgi:hypothetical protein